MYKTRNDTRNVKKITRSRWTRASFNCHIVDVFSLKSSFRIQYLPVVDWFYSAVDDERVSGSFDRNHSRVHKFKIQGYNCSIRPLTDKRILTSLYRSYNIRPIVQFRLLCTCDNKYEEFKLGKPFYFQSRVMVPHRNVIANIEAAKYQGFRTSHRSLEESMTGINWGITYALRATRKTINTSSSFKRDRVASNGSFKLQTT